MYPRKIFPLLQKHLDKKQITVLTGMRRTGKTTLVKQLLADVPLTNKLYFDLERLDNRQLFSEKNYDNIIVALQSRGLKFNQKTLIAIDEIQLVPNIPSVLKYLYDNFNIKFIITGSSSYYLRNLFSESLSGRKKIFELYPLDFGEFLIFKEIKLAQKTLKRSVAFQMDEYERLKLYYEEFINYGGFPEIVLEKDFNSKKDLLFDIASSYINKDIKLLADFRDINAIYNLLKLLASRTGSRVDVSKLANVSGLSRITVQNYLELFEKTYFIQLLPVYAKSADREIVKAKKLYFSDTGILNILSQVSSGAQFENAVFCQLRHWGQLRYYSLKSGKEIDFILDQKTALEIKETPTASDYKNLIYLAKKIGLASVKLIGRYPTPRFSKYLWGGSLQNAREPTRDGGLIRFSL